MSDSKIKAKTQPKRLREYKRLVAQKAAQSLRKQRREELSRVFVKDKVETYDDVIAIFYGLSKKAKDSAVFDRILTLARLGERPAEIMKMMEPKK
jgi:hypothetical protein